jgi:hypothetical protein
MKILVFEENLMWSSRLVKTLTAFGHTAVLVRELPIQADGASVAVINLGTKEPAPGVLVERLHELGIKVIAHAGHRETELIALGKASGADVLATNREITYKLPELVASLQ